MISNSDPLHQEIGKTLRKPYKAWSYIHYIQYIQLWYVHGWTMLCKGQSHLEIWPRVFPHHHKRLYILWTSKEIALKTTPKLRSLCAWGQQHTFTKLIWTNSIEFIEIMMTLTAQILHWEQALAYCLESTQNRICLWTQHGAVLEGLHQRWGEVK